MQIMDPHEKSQDCKACLASRDLHEFLPIVGLQGWAEVALPAVLMDSRHTATWRARGHSGSRPNKLCSAGSWTRAGHALDLLRPSCLDSRPSTSRSRERPVEAGGEYTWAKQSSTLPKHANLVHRVMNTVCSGYLGSKNLARWLTGARRSAAGSSFQLGTRLATSEILTSNMFWWLRNNVTYAAFESPRQAGFQSGSLELSQWPEAMAPRTGFERTWTHALSQKCLGMCSLRLSSSKL